MNATKTYWMDYNDGLYHFNENVSALIEEIKASNLSTEAKIATITKIVSYDNHTKERQNYVTELILLTMMMMDRPLTVTEIIMANPTLCREYSHQCVNSRVRNLVVNGVVNREEIKTGNKIEIDDNLFVEETQILFSLI